MRTRFPDKPPRIVLIGGGAGTGKTTLAARLAHELGVTWLQADAVWLALKAATTPEQYPDVHLFPDLGGARDLSVVELRERFIAASAVVCHALEATVRFQAHAGPGLVVDGAWLLPSFVAKLTSPSVIGTQVQPVFLFEPDPAEVIRSMMSRAPDGEVTPVRRQLANLSWEFGRWLRDEAESRGLPVLQPRPRETLLARTVATLEGRGVG